MARSLQAEEADVTGPTRASTVVVYTLFVVFGISAWVTVNGTFTELPRLVTTQPEGWHLASVLAVAAQVANVGPLAYYAMRRYVLHHCPRREELLVVVVIYFILLVGAASMFMLTFVCHVTMDFLGAERSVPLVFFIFTSAVADTTSSLVFWRFAGSFRPLHIAALATGEGMSGVAASLLSWIQGVSLPTPRFSAGVYFAALGVLMLASALAFHMLRASPTARAEQLHRQTQSGQQQSGAEMRAALVAASGTQTTEGGSTATVAESSQDSILATKSQAAFYGLLATLFWLNFLQNGLHVCCLPLAAKLYGRDTYRDAQTAALILDPLAVVVGYRLKLRASSLVPVVACITVVGAYVLVLSLEAVTPPLLTAGGGALLVCLVAVGRILTAYGKMRSSVLLQAHTKGAAEEHLTLAGVATQSGACMGSVLFFVLIHQSTWFRGAT